MDRFVYEKEEEGYRYPVNYEGLLNQQLGRIAYFRSNNSSYKTIEKYEEAVDTLILMLPSKLRKKALQFKKKHNIEYNISREGKKNYDKLWEYCNQIMEENG